MPTRTKPWPQWDTKFQLWCYYETADKWVMEGLFDTADEAEAHCEKLRDDVETPCMPDWWVCQVTARG